MRSNGDRGLGVHFRRENRKGAGSSCGPEAKGAVRRDTGQSGTARFRGPRDSDLRAALVDGGAIQRSSGLGPPRPGARRGRDSEVLGTRTSAPGVPGKTSSRVSVDCFCRGPGLKGRPGGGGFPERATRCWAEPRRANIAGRLEPKCPRCYSIRTWGLLPAFRFIETTHLAEKLDERPGPP